MAKNRKRPPRRRVPSNPNVLVLDREENKAKLAEREPLFSIDGVEYTIPKVVPASWAIQATEIALTKGEATALMWAMLKMLGEEGLAALQQCETLTSDDLKKLTNIIADKVLPTRSDLLPKGSSPTTSGESED